MIGGDIGKTVTIGEMDSVGVEWSDTGGYITKERCFLYRYAITFENKAEGISESFPIYVDVYVFKRNIASRFSADVNSENIYITWEPVKIEKDDGNGGKTIIPLTYNIYRAKGSGSFRWLGIIPSIGGDISANTLSSINSGFAANISYDFYLEDGKIDFSNITLML